LKKQGKKKGKESLEIKKLSFGGKLGNNRENLTGVR